MITIKNTQRTDLVEANIIKNYISLLLDALNYTDFDILVWFTTNKTVRYYNKIYRHKDKATDILSFPYHTELVMGKRIKVKYPEDKNLGDIIISTAYVKTEAIKLKQTFDDRIKILLVHGICHLLGYDHIEDSDYRRMRAKEAWLLKKLN